MDPEQLLDLFKQAEHPELLHFREHGKVSGYIRKVRSAVATGECSEWNVTDFAQHEHDLLAAREIVRDKGSHLSEWASTGTSFVVAAVGTEAIRRLPGWLGNHTHGAYLYLSGAAMIALFLLVMRLYVRVKGATSGWTARVAEYDQLIGLLAKKREELEKKNEQEAEKARIAADAALDKQLAEDKRKEDQRTQNLRKMNNTIIGSTSHDAPITRKCADGSVVPIGPPRNQRTTGVRIETRPIQDGKTSAPTIGAAGRDSEPPTHKSKKKRRGARWDRK